MKKWWTDYKCEEEEDAQQWSHYKAVLGWIIILLFLYGIAKLIIQAIFD